MELAHTVTRHFSIKNLNKYSPKLMKPLTFVYALFLLPKRSVTSHSYLLYHPDQISPYVQKRFYWRQFKFRETP